ncbi:MAG TPA: DUF6134 family protein [Gemmataceae bacterium]|nr:DUF6134 family protein [Gemmataceae bacterium]
MDHLARRCGYWLFVAIILVVPQVARATDTEFRDFSISVDGKPSGNSQFTISRQADGSFSVSTQAAVRITQVFFKYEFTTQTSEQWKDGRLVTLNANTNDNGKKFEVKASAMGPGLRVQVNGQPDRPARADAWTNSFWKLADAKYHNKEIPVLEEDTGKEFTGRLLYIGTESLTVANQKQDCYHFRLTGGSYPVDLWFDRYHLLVKQDFVESGHRTIMLLTNIRR